jgi:hypothetical protein
MKEKIKAEVDRFKKFQKTLLNLKDETKIEDIDIRNYAKYILRDGRDYEKRELLSCFKTRIKL